MLTNFYHLLESAPSTPTEPLLKPLTSWLSNAAGTLFNLLLVEPNAEPKVIQIEAQNGEWLWEIYEPITEQTFYCMTEDEVLQWFDRNRWI